MKDSKIELTICLGSSCFARGNKATLRAIKQFLEEHQLTERITFHGGHCFGKCAEGPVISINGKQFSRVDELSVIDILTDELLDQPNQ